MTQATSPPNPSTCESCPAFQAGNLKQLGIDMDSWDYVIALAGKSQHG